MDTANTNTFVPDSSAVADRLVLTIDRRAVPERDWGPALGVVERRRYPRQSAPAPARIALKGVRRQVNAAVVDVSPTGACLRMDGAQMLTPGTAVRVTWTIPGEAGGKGRRLSLQGTIIRQAATSASTQYVGVRFATLIQDQVRASEARLHKLCVGTLIVLLAGVIAALKFRNVISFWYEPVFQLYSLFTAAYILSRVGISLRYREPEDQGYVPTVSVIVAAKNEAANIASTVRSIFASRYPAHAIDVLVVDDGSTDHTWNVLRGLRGEFPHLKIFRFERNRGKRHAMALGARESRAQILVYVDSDSFMDPEGLYRIVQPFANPKVGAVAGHTQVIIEPHNFLSKMEAVRYFVSQRVMKAAESVFHTVTCCPGPFSAYRREAVLSVLPDWENQRFLGTAATFGDDRSLTNFILPRYRVVYHAGARVATYVPDRWMVFFRQQLRWKKSWARETTIAVRFMYRKHPFAAMAYYFGVVITLFSPLIAVRAMIVQPFRFGNLSFVPYLLGLLLVYMFFGLVYQYHTQSKRWQHGLAFALLYVFILSFQNYYAMLTVRQNHWGTR